jgi:hypothetical protein
MKFRDKTGKIMGYRLVDLKGQKQNIKPEILKAAIKKWSDICSKFNTYK